MIPRTALRKQAKMTIEEEGQEEPGHGMSPEAMRAVASAPFSRVRDNLIGVLQQGFEQIESAGFDSQEMEDDWNKYKIEVEDFFRNASPNDPRFTEKLREMTTKFAKGTN